MQIMKEISIICAFATIFGHNGQFAVEVLCNQRSHRVVSNSNRSKLLHVHHFHRVISIANLHLTISIKITPPPPLDTPLTTCLVTVCLADVYQAASNCIVLTVRHTNRWVLHVYSLSVHRYFHENPAVYLKRYRVTTNFLLGLWSSTQSDALFGTHFITLNRNITHIVLI